MDVNVIHCPNCGAKIKIQPHAEYVICEYCDSQVVVDDGHEKVEYIDQARIKEAEVESKRIDELRWEKEKELEQLYRWQKIRNAWFAVIIILFCVVVLAGSYDQVSTIASRILACVLIAGFFVWGIKPKISAPATSTANKPKKKKETPGTHWQVNEYEEEDPYDQPYVRREPYFDPVDTHNQIPEKKLPWYIRTGSIIVIGLFTEGLYWIIGPIIRIWWKKNH